MYISYNQQGYPSQSVNRNGEGGGMDTEVAVRVRRQWNWNRDNIKFGGIRRVDMEVEAM